MKKFDVYIGVNGVEFLIKNIEASSANTARSIAFEVFMSKVTVSRAVEDTKEFDLNRSNNRTFFMKKISNFVGVMREKFIL